MTELTPEAKRLLAHLRAVDDPTAQERARGDAAVRGMLEAHGLVGMPPLAAKLSAGASAKLAWSMAAALVVALGLYAAQALRAPAPHLSAPAQPASFSEGGALDRAASTEALGTAPSAPHETRQRDDTPEAAAAGSKAHVRRGTAKSAPSALSEELKFVASVDAELRSGDYEHALQRLAQHKGSPALAEERAALRVLALCGRDNDAAAARARDQFLQGAPSSVLGARVRAACNAEPRP